MATIDRNPKLIEAIRLNPAAYLSQGRTTDLRDLALELATDAVYLNAPDVSILQQNDWRLVASSVDWLIQGSKWSIEELFYRIEFIHSYRPNANRAPVLLAAFAEDVVTFLNSEPLIIQGPATGLSELANFVRQSLDRHRVVAFRGPRSAA